VRFLAWNPDVDDPPERNPVLCDDGRIRTAEHVHQQLRRSFGSAAWRLKAEEKARTISRFSFKFMTTTDIARPTTAVYERIEGISRSYQYLMIKEGDVLVQGHSCWFLPCLQVAMIGHSALTSNYVIKGCARGAADAGLYEYANKNCRAKKGAGAGDPDARAREHGHAGGVTGQYLLFGAYDEDKDGDVIWLARAVADAELGGRCCKRMGKRTLLHRDESQSTAFSAGDWAIAVEWLERAGSDPDRLAFVPGDGIMCFVNSTELRRIVAEGGVSPRPGVKRGEVVLSRKEKADAQDWCR
jgi:hypothetical protein